MSIASESAERLKRIASLVEFPTIKCVAVPSASTNPCQDAEFGFVVLQDGSAGAFYVWLDDTQKVLGGDDFRELEGLAPAKLLAGVSHERLERRALALGVMNAMSQSIFTRARLELPGAASMGGMTFSTADRVGMVGLFPSLTRRLQAGRIAFVVIEKRAELIDVAHPFEVTNDVTRLAECNKILITGSTLLNESLAATLQHCVDAQTVAVIGPSASCLPDVAFSHGVHRFGGARIRNLDTLLERRRNGLPWGDSVQKYLLDARTYPGIAPLCTALAS